MVDLMCDMILVPRWRIGAAGGDPNAGAASLPGCDGGYIMTCGRRESGQDHAG